MRNINYINGIEGIVVGGTATANVPINRRYHSLKVIVSEALSALAVDVVSKVRLYVNGQIMRDLTPAQYIAIASLNGITASTGEIPIFFSEPWRATVLGEEATSWDLFEQTKCTLEITFKTGINSPQCKVLASYDYGRNVSGNTNFLSIIKQLVQTYNAPSGQYDLVTIPVSNPLQRIHLSASTGTITNVDVYRDNEKVHEGSDVQNSMFLKDYKLVGTAFTYPIVFDYEQQISSPLVVGKDLLVRPTLSAANTLTVLIESRANGYN